MGAMEDQPKAPFSVHARGVQLLDHGRLMDGQYIGLSAFRSLRDISGSLYTFLLIQARVWPFVESAAWNLQAHSGVQVLWHVCYQRRCSDVALSVAP